MIKIDDRSRFNLDDFCKFLGASTTPEALDIASNWKVINPLSRMKKKANEKFDHKEIPENIDLLYQRYPLLHEVNLRYEKILNNIQV